MDEFNWQRMRRRTRSWFQKHQRATLPWRESQNPYYIWVSEIMLQQTTVATVRSYFERFIKAFPTVHDLAKAEEAAVLKLWEGLGYYSRARNLRKAAQQLVEESDGVFPSEPQDLQKLPGIGRYTAGAIASIAFNLRAPIVEANTLRLYSRLLAYKGDPRSKAGQDLLWKFAEDVLPNKDVGNFNLAMMDIGSLVCKPVAPNCPGCPLQMDCRAFARKQQHEIPMKPVKPEITYTMDGAVVLWKEGRLALRQYAPGERWVGLWDFPRFSLDEGLKQAGIERTDGHIGHLDVSQTRKLLDVVEQEFLQRFDLTIRADELLTRMKHTVTRYRIQLMCVEAQVDTRDLEKEDDLTWILPEQLEQYPFSTTGRKLASLIEKRQGDKFLFD
ncbi:A/G-specific adenine glycosylase [Polystyrenella longa]|uniref:Adenine DNA glycosylase n=1 Tax=Polystyrenella longa TaxID=2528007 RepID=A0A518CPZ7_9PLAN|nr:A/G-specific adenine glycosylase [Polystyrenella longa]QDU81301.1 A/G-specific adenine glycosylase [Polystyrenella longa]